MLSPVPKCDKFVTGEGGGGVSWRDHLISPTLNSPTKNKFASFRLLNK